MSEKMVPSEIAAPLIDDKGDEEIKRTKDRIERIGAKIIVQDSPEGAHEKLVRITGKDRNAVDMAQILVDFILVEISRDEYGYGSEHITAYV